MTDPDIGPELVQLLTPEGRRVQDPRLGAYDARVAALSPDTLRAMYGDMVLARRFDTEATALQRQGELALFAPALGQEGAQIGSAHALAPQDYVFPAYREHGVLLVRGVDMREVMRLFRGVDHGGWDPAEHKVHLYTLVIGSHTLHATGYAMGVQRDGLVGTGDPARDTAVVTYFGDGATSQGDVHEAMVFAAVNNAPVVFVCQNNQWAISVPTSGQSTVPLARRGTGVGIPSVRVDGNDVLASYAVTAEALDRARSGGGPTFIEAYTYRMGAHTTSDDPTRYRLPSELEEWQARDPIMRLRTFLTNQKLADDDFFAQVDEEAQAAASQLRERVLAMPDPPPEKMFDHVYPHGSPELDRQREQFLAYAASFEGGAH